MKLRATFAVCGGCLYLKGEGEFDPATAREITLDWVREAKEKKVNLVLCDIRGVGGIEVGALPLIERYLLGEFAANVIPKGIRLAILETPEQYTKDRFDENVLANRGVTVKITTDLKEALAWLGVEGEGVG